MKNFCKVLQAPLIRDIVDWRVFCCCSRRILPEFVFNESTQNAGKWDPSACASRTEPVWQCELGLCGGFWLCKVCCRQTVQLKPQFAIQILRFHTRLLCCCARKDTFQSPLGGYSHGQGLRDWMAVSIEYFRSKCKWRRNDDDYCDSFHSAMIRRLHCFPPCTWWW